MLFAIAALLVVAAQAPVRPPRPEPPPLLPGTSSIAGRVVDAADKPVEGAEVILTEKPVPGTNSPMRSSKALTNRDGFYEFRNISANSYLMLVMHKHHQPSCLASWSQCPEIDLLPDQARANLDVQMRPSGSARGRLIDFEGRPVSGIGVMAWFEGRPVPGGTQNVSDADGRFEINGMPPGLAVIAAEVRGGQAGPTRVYYPGVLDANEAQPFMIAAGSTIEIEMRVPEITATSITANISGPDGYRIDHLNLLRPETKMRLPLSTHESVVTAINLRQGRYVLEARATVGDEALAASAVVDLQAVDIEVPLHLQPAGSVSGKIVLERGGLPPVNGVRVVAVWTIDGVEVKPSPEETSVGPDGVFRFTGLFGHRDLRVVGLPDDWQVTAIRAGRSDITASGLDIASGSTTELTIVVARR